MKKIKIVIAEDMEDARDNLIELIQRQHDMEVIGVAKDGIETLEILEKVTPDVLLLDIIMPNLDGLGVLKKINYLHLPKPKILITSAMSECEIVKEAMGLGADYCVTKPINYENLIHRIRKLAYGTKPENPDKEKRKIDKGNAFLENKIMHIFRKLEISLALKGGRYLKQAIEMVASEGRIDFCLKTLYSDLAKKHGIGENKIRRDIQYVIKTTWKKGKLDVFFHFKPTTKEFIKRIVRAIL